ncbi:putative chloride channel-like protein CLC-g [Senna tora]|uniref:Putative chloride channel-like protein CLC-g n=1 Tax=Senna tora TaxID=362788 RepID=A0A835CEU0_9FABA|nr:putative chloride channel-like protein CLC-g [Senna tora]
METSILSTNPSFILKLTDSIQLLRLPSSAPTSPPLRASITSLSCLSLLFLQFSIHKFLCEFAPQFLLFLFFSSLSVCRIFENEFFKQDWRSRGKLQIFQYVLMKWLLCALIGLIVSLIGFCNNLAVENIAGLKFVVTSNMMLQRRFVMAFLVFFASNLGLTLFASVITAFIAPAATGSGIPEVKAYLNGVDAPGIYTLRTLFVKIIGSISAVSSSLLVGKAGPMVHTGACVASLLGQGGSKRYGLTWNWLRFFKNDRDRRDLIICGSAAGITAAFRAPVGGVLFALEEMASWWRSALLWRAFFTTAIVAIVLRALIDVCLSDVPSVFILGVIGGILGSLYNSLLTIVLRAYNSIHEKGFAYKILLACIISIFTSCLLFGLPWLASCRPCPLDATEACPTIGRSGNYKKFQCSPGHYNDLASLIFNTNDDAIRNLFSKNTDEEFSYSSMLIFFVTCFFLSIFSYGIVAPAGLFVPVIVTGASYGRFFGMLVGKNSTLNHGLYAVLGAASLLGGSMRMTVSLADAFNANIYDLIMKAKGFPYLETHAEPYMRQLTVGDVVTGPLQLFSGIEKVRNIVFVLRTTGHNGFPVIDEPPYSEVPVLFGVILRAHLLTLLKKKAFLSRPVAIGDEAFNTFSADEFAKRGSGNYDNIDDIQLTEEEMDMFIDLHPFTNASPYTVVETMSLGKALTLFREVGLRHLLVVPKISGVSNSVLPYCHFIEQVKCGLVEITSCGYTDKARFYAGTHTRFESFAGKKQVEKIKN